MNYPPYMGLTRFMQIQLEQIGERLGQLIKDEDSLQTELSSNATRRQEHSHQIATSQVCEVRMLSVVELRITGGIDGRHQCS